MPSPCLFDPEWIYANPCAFPAEMFLGAVVTQSLPPALCHLL